MNIFDLLFAAAGGLMMIGGPLYLRWLRRRLERGLVLRRALSSGDR